MATTSSYVLHMTLGLSAVTIRTRLRSAYSPLIAAFSISYPALLGNIFRDFMARLL